jgi:23S rRNA G2069 N7-methylase RlmK/C1962 C5-methylase RlmI
MPDEGAMMKQGTVLLEELVTASVNRRAGKSVCRLIWSEADSLPGLVVDRYNDLITIQALTCGMDRRLATIIDVLQRLLHPREIVLRNDASTRKLEGLRQEIINRINQLLPTQLVMYVYFNEFVVQ